MTQDIKTRISNWIKCLDVIDVINMMPDCLKDRDSDIRDVLRDARDEIMKLRSELKSTDHYKCELQNIDGIDVEVIVPNNRKRFNDDLTYVNYIMLIEADFVYEMNITEFKIKIIKNRYIEFDVDESEMKFKDIKSMNVAEKLLLELNRSYSIKNPIKIQLKSN